MSEFYTKRLSTVCKYTAAMALYVGSAVGAGYLAAKGTISVLESNLAIDATRSPTYTRPSDGSPTPEK